MPSPQNPQSSPQTAARNLPRRRLILILAALAAFGPLSIDMYLPAFPEIALDLRVADSMVRLSLSAFLLGVAAGQLFYGPLSDRVGRRRPLLAGMALFTLAALACALVRSAEALIGWRLVMALGGSAGMGLSRAVIRDKFAPQDAADAFSMLAVVMGAAPILAPLLGGQLLEHAGWRSVFWTLAAAGVAVWLAVWFWLPESLSEEKRGRTGAKDVFTDYTALLSNRAFMGCALILGFNAAALFTYITCAPGIFIKLNGMTPQEFSWFFGINALGMIGGAQLNRHLLRRYSPKQILGVILALVLAAGILLAACSIAGIGGFPALVILLFLTLASGGMIGPNATVLALAPLERSVGSAAALLGTIQFGMGGISGAIAGMFGVNTSIPMCLTLALCALAASLAFGTLVAKRKLI